MKKKFIHSSCTILVLAMLSVQTAHASGNQEVRLNLNGVNVEGQHPVIMNNHTMVPLRTVALISDAEVSWNAADKTVMMTDPVSQKQLKLQAGSSIAYVGGQKTSLDVPPMMKDGTLYVPFRFIADSLQAQVMWDAPSQTVVMYKSDEKLTEALHGSDLAKARNAAIRLPRITLHDSLTAKEEGGGGTYYFRSGERDRFMYIDRGIARYFEIRNGAAWGTFEARVDTGNKNLSGELPLQIPVMGESWGVAPVFKGCIDFFRESWTTDQVRYGIYDTTGKTLYEGKNPVAVNTGDVIAELPVFLSGEQTIKQLMAEKMGVIDWSMSKEGDIYSFVSVPSDPKAEGSEYQVNSRTGTVYDATSGGPQTNLIIDNAPNLKAIWNGNAYQEELLKLAGPILQSYGLVPASKTWIGGGYGDGYIYGAVLKDKTKIWIKLDLFTKEWEEIEEP